MIVQIECINEHLTEKYCGQLEEIVDILMRQAIPP
jgi:hypothetical protein